MCTSGSKTLYYTSYSEPFSLKKNTLPSNDEVLKYYFSRDDRGENATKVRTLAKNIEDLWCAADCCPVSIKVIINKITDLVDLFRNYSRKNRSHKKSKPTTVSLLTPTRKSPRSSGNTLSSPENTQTGVHEKGDQLIIRRQSVLF